MDTSAAHRGHPRSGGTLQATDSILLINAVTGTWNKTHFHRHLLKNSLEGIQK